MPKINRTYTKRLDPRAPLVFDKPGDRQVLPLERLQCIDDQDYGLGEADRA